MSRRSERYSIGRAFPILFISFFLGGVWGATVAPILGVVAVFSSLGELGWQPPAGGTLVLTLYFVQKVAGRTSKDADATEIRWSQIDKIISILSFSAAYILAWLIIRDLSIAIAADPAF
jgi:hypothetical protein